jgi:hypothetical protein
MAKYFGGSPVSLPFTRRELTPHFRSVLPHLLARGWDQWVKESDDCQETAARILEHHLRNALDAGETEATLFRMLITERKEATFAEFISMVRFCEEWEGCK